MVQKIRAMNKKLYFFCDPLFYVYILSHLHFSLVTVRLWSHSPNVTFLYPLKTSENLRRLSDVFRGYRKVTLGEYGLKGSFWDTVLTVLEGGAYLRSSDYWRKYVGISENIFTNIGLRWTSKKCTKCANINYKIFSCRLFEMDVRTKK